MLIEKAKKIRKRILDIAYKTGKGHLGGTLSLVDILVAIYYGGVLKYGNKEKDLLLIGKGHACLASYAIWEDLGLLSKDLLDTFGTNGSLLGTQFDKNFLESEYNTGSLGHVIGIGAGYALALKLGGNSQKKIFVVVGDGECEEGSIWESIDFIAKNKIAGLTIIVDRNRLSVTDFIENDRLVDKFEAFGLRVIEMDGHDFYSILTAFDSIDNESVIIIFNTIKGKGISFLENNVDSHSGILNKEQYIQASKELNG
ncbi:MAG: transketolase [Candidatus Omnitrophica bacterium]|jgi:transketolase|nr:transketolase [Candidatus Omnitrophota bacterium]